MVVERKYEKNNNGRKERGERKKDKQMMLEIIREQRSLGFHHPAGLFSQTCDGWMLSCGATQRSSTLASQEVTGAGKTFNTVKHVSVLEGTRRSERAGPMPGRGCGQ